MGPLTVEQLQTEVSEMEATVVLIRKDAEAGQREADIELDEASGKLRDMHTELRFRLTV